MKAVAFAAVALLAFAAAAADPAPSRSVVVLHPSNGTAAMDRSQLAQIYKGVRRSWNAQLRITVYLPPTNSAAMASLASGIFKVPRAEDVATFYSTAVLRKIFTEAPETLTSSEEVLRRVAAEPGAIAVIDADAASGAPGVKVIEVTGL